MYGISHLYTRANPEVETETETETEIESTGYLSRFESLKTAHIRTDMGFMVDRQIDR